MYGQASSVWFHRLFHQQPESNHRGPPDQDQALDQRRGHFFTRTDRQYEM